MNREKRVQHTELETLPVRPGLTLGIEVERMQLANLPIRSAVSAGGVVFCLEDGATYVVICGRLKTSSWSLPKGSPVEGESLEDAAIREVREETGLNAEIIAGLGMVEYWFVGMPERVRYHKVVHYFLMRSLGGDISNHDWEFDLVKWVLFEVAIHRVSYANEKDILVKAAEALNNLEVLRGGATQENAAL